MGPALLRACTATLVSDSEVVKRLMREIEGLAPSAKKEFSASYIWWALVEEEKVNKAARM